MKNNDEVILDLLKNSLDLHAVQIAELLDMDLEVAQNTLAMLAKDNKVIAKPVIVQNKMTSTSYSLPPTALPVMPALNAEMKFDISSLLKKNLSADEYRGYLKANVIDLTLRGDCTGAYEYAYRLVSLRCK